MPPKEMDSEPDLTPEQVLSEVDTKMDRTLDAFKRDLNQLRTGRATPALIENVPVDYYGAPTPLKQIASIAAPDPRAIQVTPWDRGSLREIEKGLIKSDLGLNPSNDGAVITVPIPALTNDRRQEMVKLLKKKVEDGKVSLRNVRRDGLDTLRKLEKDKAISQDENRRAQEQLQKVTDGHSKRIDETGSAKEAEIRQV
jgi:ribosome recycling factor